MNNKHMDTGLKVGKYIFHFMESLILMIQEMFTVIDSLLWINNPVKALHRLYSTEVIKTSFITFLGYPETL